MEKRNSLDITLDELVTTTEQVLSVSNCLLLSIFYTLQLCCASFTVPLRQLSHAQKILIFREIF